MPDLFMLTACLGMEPWEAPKFVRDCKEPYELEARPFMATSAADSFAPAMFYGLPKWFAWEAVVRPLKTVEPWLLREIRLLVVEAAPCVQAICCGPICTFDGMRTLFAPSTTGFWRTDFLAPPSA